MTNGSTSTEAVSRLRGGFVIRHSSFVIRASFPIILLVSGCASGDKPKSEYASLKWEQRINKQIKDPHSISSPFQKDVFKASRSVKTSAFKAGEFHVEKGFSGGDDKFKAGAFAQSDKASKAASRTFSGADDQSRMGESTFKTSQNRFSGQTSSSADKASPLGDDSFNTAANPAALKAASNAKRPLIQDTGKPSYTEDEVRKILNKD